MCNISAELIKDLESKSYLVRKTLIEVLTNARSWHLGSTLSCADILTCLYFNVMKYDPRDPKWADRDRFILSKGHASALLYVVLAMTGYFDMTELMNYRKPLSILQGHPDRTLTPGVEVSAGSLGQGLSAAVGIALAGKMDKKHYRVFCLIGDGESHEGQIWEAAMSASHYGLDNLVAITDYNKCSSESKIKDSMGLEPLLSKWEAFGWNAVEINGHKIGEILRALNDPPKLRKKPIMIIAHTVKGKGVSFMEDQVIWHGKQISKEEGERALAELERNKKGG